MPSHGGWLEYPAASSSAPKHGVAGLKAAEPFCKREPR